MSQAGYTPYGGMNYSVPPVPMISPPGGGFAIPSTPESGARPIGAMLLPSVVAKTANGASAHFQQMFQQQQSVLTLFLPLASQYQGTRALFADMLLMGSFATKNTIDQLEALGIHCAATVAGDKLQIQLAGPSGQEAQLTQAALQLLCRPQWDGPTLGQIRKETVETIKRHKSEPQSSGLEYLNKCLYSENHPFGASAQQILQSYEGTSLGQLQGLHRQLMQYPEQFTFSMVSSLPVEAQMQCLNQAIAQQNWYASPYRQDPPLPPAIQPQALRGTLPPVLVEHPHAERAEVICSWRAPAKNDPDYTAYLLILRMLGSMSGGFFKTLRSERGLVYGTRQQNQTAPGFSVYRVMAQVNFDKLPKALEGIEEVVGELIDKPIPQNRLAAAKEALLFETMTSCEEARQQAEHNNHYINQEMLAPHPQQIQEALQRVRVEDIRRVAARIFRPQQSGGVKATAIVAPEAILKQYYPGQTYLPHVNV